MINILRAAENNMFLNNFVHIQLFLGKSQYPAAIETVNKGSLNIKASCNRECRRAQKHQ